MIEEEIWRLWFISFRCTSGWGVPDIRGSDGTLAATFRQGHAAMGSLADQ
jgi:hypothetical protein